ncbi:MAG TPA: hypothetical protein PKY59_27220 [Pyrinomonadaceae bacterium]|nr:hypothetical protein [Pyrinomonadaceae bacterium]
MQYKFIFKLFNLRQLLVVVSLIVLVSCQKQTATSFVTPVNTESIKEIPKDWRKIETDYFSFSIPPTMKNQNVRGIDSEVMSFENEEMTLDIEYGDFSADVVSHLLDYEGKKQSIIIDGKKTEIVSYDINKPIYSPNKATNAANKASNGDDSFRLKKVEKNYVFGINFPLKDEPISSENRFAASFVIKSKSIEAKETAKIIFQSIKFKD